MAVIDVDVPVIVEPVAANPRVVATKAVVAGKSATGPTPAEVAAAVTAEATAAEAAAAATVDKQRCRSARIIERTLWRSSPGRRR